jgi:hypothetical protein
MFVFSFGACERRFRTSNARYVVSIVDAQQRLAGVEETTGNQILRNPHHVPGDFRHELGLRSRRDRALRVHTQLNGPGLNRQHTHGRRHGLRLSGLQRASVLNEHDGDCHGGEQYEDGG